MTNDSTDTQSDESTDTGAESSESTDALTAQASSTYKILGELDNGSGAGVLGKNIASSGTPIGVEGAVPNNTNSGFGLSTPHNARVEGDVESPGSHVFTVDGTPTLELQSTTTGFDGSPVQGGNVIAGYEGNGVGSNVGAATISGGGDSGSDDLGGDIGVRDAINKVTGDYGTICGGANNRASISAVVGGGKRNTASTYYATVGGGLKNNADAQRATISGGSLNTVTGEYGTVSGGTDNEVKADYATVPGGFDNVADGEASFAAGYKSEVNGYEGTFVWSGKASSIVTATGKNQFIVEATGGIGLGTSSPAAQLHVADNVSSNSTDLADNVVVIENENTSDTGDLLALKINASTPDFGNNYIQFLNDSNDGVGRIEGNNSGGVAYETTGADYAEYLRRRDPEERIEAGDVVGVVDDEITLATDDAHDAFVVTDAPGVLGNAPPEDDRDAHETVAFTGQVPVNVDGPVTAGDLVVPAGDEDGRARAVSPAEWTPGDGPVVGRAWESDDTAGVSAVTVAVGIDDPTLLGDRLESQRDRIEDLEAENEQLRADLDAKDQRIDEQADRIDELEDRLAAIENQVGRTATPADD